MDTTELKESVQREEHYLQETRQTVAEVRRWRASQATGSWRQARHCAIAGAFALVAAFAAGAGYAVASKPYANEVQNLRARIALTELVEDRVLAMTPAERKQFDALMKWPRR
jgi:hypothetical protein